MKNITTPYIKESFIPAGECQQIIQLVQRYSNNENGVQAYIHSLERILIDASSVNGDGFHSEAHLLDSICRRMMTEVEGALVPEKSIYLGFTVVQGNYTGDSHTRHADSRRLDPVDNRWVPNHTPNWVITCGLYLNKHGTDFTGGELVFPALNLSVPSKPGLLVAFPSDERFEHEVPMIATGARYAILSWFTDNAEAKGRPIIPALETPTPSL